MAARRREFIRGLLKIVEPQRRDVANHDFEATTAAQSVHGRGTKNRYQRILNLGLANLAYVS